MSLEHKNNGSLENGYFDRINHDILKNIPIYSKKILEIGCGAGALASKFKETNPRCEYHGIELSSEAAEFAITNKRIDRIHIANIEQQNLSSLGYEESSFDTLIYGDVLEHLIDPWSVIEEHQKFIKKNGFIIASIPNIANFSIIYQLLNGKWNYQDEGLLDRTHLRFFTLESIKNLFANAKMNIIKLEARCVNLEAHEQFINAIQPTLISLNLDSNKVSDITKVFQYIVVAQKI